MNLPARGLAAGTPVVASHNPQLLRLFKRFVLQEWEARVSNTTDGLLREVDRLEYEKLRATLELLIPGSGRGANGEEG